MDVKIKGYEKDFRIADGRQGYFTEEEAHLFLVSAIQTSSWFPKYQRAVENDPREFKYMEQILGLEGNTLMFEHGDQTHRLILDNAQVIPFDKKRKKYTALRTTDGLQTVETPREIAYEQIEKFTEYIDDITSKKWLVPVNDVYVHVLVKNFNVPPKQITFIADCDRTAEIVSEKYNVEKIHRVGYDNTRPKGEQLEIMPKIIEHSDVIITNPPYQTPTEKSEDDGGCGSRNTLWDKFITEFLLGGYLNEGGYLIAIHPAKWRKPLSDLFTLLAAKRMRYLEMHTVQDAYDVFDAGTTYDWYILQNSPPEGTTTVKGIDGKITEIDLSGMDFLANCDFELVEKMLAKDGDERCEVLFSRSEYGSDKPWMSRTQSDKFPYPCLHHAGAKETKYWYSSRKDEFFGVPKVIFGEQTTNRIYQVIVDVDGEYGITQECIGIAVRDQEEADKVSKALMSKQFERIIKSCHWSPQRIDWRFFGFLRRDWYNLFV